MIKNRKWTFFPIIVIVILLIGIIIPVHAGTTNNPAISVAVSPLTITKGDTLHVTGTSSDNPSSGISIWILCQNYAEVVTIQPDSTGMFSYDLEGTTTSSLPNTGLCYIVAQHPMQNNQFDIYLKSSTVSEPGYGEVYNRLLDSPVKLDDTHLFKIFGGGKIAGADAEFCLTDALKEPSIDDSYAETQFSVAAPTTTNPTQTATTSVTSGTVPIISTISPSSGTVLGNTLVTITVSGMHKDSDISWVKFGNTLGSVTGINKEEGSSTTITVLSPPSSSGGVVDVVVISSIDRDSGRTIFSAPAKYTYTSTTPRSTMTQLTTIPTSHPTTAMTTIPPYTQKTTVVTTIPSPIPTSTVDYDATIAAMQSQIAEQNAKIEEQGSWIDQILRFLGLK